MDQVDLNIFKRWIGRYQVGEHHAGLQPFGETGGRDIQYRCRWQKLLLDDGKNARSILMTWNRGHLKLKRAKPGLAVDKSFHCCCLHCHISTHCHNDI